jgi:hypothetical protein
VKPRPAPELDHIVRLRRPAATFTGIRLRKRKRDFLELILTIVPVSPCIWLPTLSGESDDRPIATAGNEQQEVNPMTALMAAAHGPATSGPRSAMGGDRKLHFNGR